MLTDNHFTVSTEHVPTKEKGRPTTGTPDEPITEADFTVPAPLQGWFNLAKHALDRQPKQNWKRGKQRGHTDAYLLAQLATLAVIMLLISGGLNHG